MSYFNFLPKYHYKFYLFKIIKNLEGEKNDSKIIESFFDEQNKIIKKNISNFFCKMNKDNYPDLNLYKNLLKLKKVISKSYENSFRFFKLYGYSLTFPFKYLQIYMENNNKNNILFDDSLKSNYFKLRYSFPFIEKVVDNMIEGYNNDDKIDIKLLSGSAYGNALEIKIREKLNKFKQKIDVRKVWSLNSISANVKNQIMKKQKYLDRYKNLEDINGLQDIKISEYKYFYFKPENQDNKLFDSLILVKIKDNEFNIIAFQITKNKPKNKVKDKTEYTNFLCQNIKTKFENLYKIKISTIYFLYILCNDTLENESLCKILNNEKIEYIFYSLKDKCFYKERNEIKINDAAYFMDKNAIVFSNKIKKKNPSTESIDLFEEFLYDNFIKKNEIYFENVRNKYFGYNFGPKIEDNLKKLIINNLKKYIPYKNKYEILFLFGFSAEKLQVFRKLKENDELIYLFKLNNRVYLLFKNKSFEIDSNNNIMKDCAFPTIDKSKLKKEVKFNKDVIKFSSIDSIYVNSIIYLFKIYYLGENLEIE